MKITKILFTALVALLFSQTMTGQDESEFTIQKGDNLDINLTYTGTQFIVKQNPSYGTLTLESETDNSVYYVYTPNPDFVGSDNFKFQEINTGVFPPSFKNYSFLVNVVESVVNASDDFVMVTDENEITIDPSSNDESLAGELDIEIAQVMFGSASVNDDNTILYTPAAGEDDDYIVYTGTDMYGTSSTATIYVTKESVPADANTSETFDVASGNIQYIRLPYTDYSFDGQDLENGTLAVINDYMVKYTAAEQADGVDEFTFTSEAGLIHTVSAHVKAVAIDDGYVKNDLIFSASNTLVQFDVKENDENSQTVVTDYSEELIHFGDGVFAYTPEPDYSGVKTFSYTVDDGQNEEDGTITIVVNNYEPSTNVDYSLSTPQDQPRVIEYEVPLGTEYFEIEDYPEHGTVEVFSNEEEIDLACTEGIQKVFAVYTPADGYVGSDEITLRYCASDNNVCDNVVVALEVEATDVEDCICVDDCVWPGDTNGDGVVNVRDLISIARHMGAKGEARTESPYADIYAGEEPTVWPTSQYDGSSVGRADADGDGIVTASDLDVIVDNYGNINSIIKDDLFGVKNVPFEIVNDTDVEVGEVKTIYVSIGNDAYPAIDMHGITFAVSVGANVLDPASVEVEFLEDNFFVKHSPFISMFQQPSPGQIYVSGAKTNALGSTGSGIIASVSFIVVEDADGIRPMRKRNSNEDNTVGTITVAIDDIVFEDGQGFKYSLPSTSAELNVVDNKKHEEAAAFELSPNPTSDNVTVISKNKQIIETVDIFSLTGEVVKTVSNVNSKSVQLDVNALNNGLYFVKIKGDKASQIIKLVKN